MLHTPHKIFCQPVVGLEWLRTTTLPWAWLYLNLPHFPALRFLSQIALGAALIGGSAL